MADDGMLIRNHNFNRSAELVSADSWHVTTSLEAEAKITRLEAEFASVEAGRTSLLLELEASKCEVSSLYT